MDCDQTGVSCVATTDQTSVTPALTTPSELNLAETQRVPGIHGIEIKNMSDIYQHVLSHIIDSAVDTGPSPCTPTETTDDLTSVTMATNNSSTEPAIKEENNSSGASGGSGGSLVTEVKFHVVSGLGPGSVSVLIKTRKLLDTFNFIEQCMVANHVLS